MKQIDVIALLRVASRGCTAVTGNLLVIGITDVVAVAMLLPIVPHLERVGQLRAVASTSDMDGSEEAALSLMLLAADRDLAQGGAAGC